MEIRNFIKSITGALRTKKYVGILPGTLPINQKTWGSSDFLNAYDISLYTNRAVAKRSDKVGEVEFVLKDKAGNKIDNDPVLDVLYKPNKVFSGTEFWKLYQKYYDLVGEVYILIEKDRKIYENAKVTGLHLLIPTLVTKKFGEDGLIKEYQYRTAESTITYQKDEVIYIHNPNPASPMNGISLLKAGVSAIQTEVQIASYHSRILDNGGKVEGVFKFKTGPLTAHQLEEIKDKYEKEYSGAKKAGRPLFLGGDADYVTMGLTPQEMSYLEAKKMTLEDICILTGVPKSMLASTSDVKFDNANADRAIFLRETIKPLLKTLTDSLDYALFPMDKELTYVDPTPENIEEKRKNIETASAINALTTNEKREALNGIGMAFDSISGADDILVPFNMAPLGSESSSDQGQSTKGIKANVEHPLKDFDMRRLYWNMQIKRMDKREGLFMKDLKAYLNEQEERVLGSLKQKRYFRKANMDELLNIELEVKIGKKTFVPVLTDLLKLAGIDAMEFGGSAGAFNLTSDIVTWLDNRAEVFLTQINKTTFDALKDEFEASLTAGEGREALISRIQQLYGDVRKARAGTIARTEVHNSTQYGTLQGYKQAGMTTKIWVAVMDGSTRDSHVAVDGEERPIDRPFSNGLMMPGDPKGSAEEVINCRCVI